MGVMGIVKSFSVHYRMYLAFEFLEAALGYGFTSAAYVLSEFQNRLYRFEHSENSR